MTSNVKLNFKSHIDIVTPNNARNNCININILVEQTVKFEGSYPITRHRHLPEYESSNWYNLHIKWNISAAIFKYDSSFLSGCHLADLCTFFLPNFHHINWQV